MVSCSRGQNNSEGDKIPRGVLSLGTKYRGGQDKLLHRHSGSVVECPLCDLEVAGLIPSRVIPKTLKMVLAGLSLGAQH